MDKKEQKRDIAVFSHNMKELMQDPLPDLLKTLDRDIQNFIYGRIVLLAKHSSAPIGSIADIGAVAGAAVAGVISVLISDTSGDDRVSAINNAKDNLIQGFDAILGEANDTGVLTGNTEFADTTDTSAVEHTPT